MLRGSEVINIIKFHEEYREKFPKKLEHIAKLEKIYNDLDMQFSMQRNIIMKANYKDNLVLGCKRFGLNPDEIFNIVNNPPKIMGTILKEKSHCYQTAVAVPFYAFPNHPIIKQTFTSFRRYIGVGFVDLSMFLFADFDSSTKPITFIGYDLNIISIARAYVIYSMMCLDYSVSSILEIWFSSTITERTYKAFLNTCLILLDDPNLIGDSNPKRKRVFLVDHQEEVLAILKYWTNPKSGLTQENAKEMWLQSIDEGQIEVVKNLRYSKDRIDYMKYILTGEIDFDSGKGKYGNYSIFNYPSNERCSNYQRTSESIFAFLTMDNLAEGESLWDRCILTLMKGVIQTKKLIISGEIFCGFNCTEVSLDNLPIIKEIRSLEPALITWSNIPDYMDPAKFIKLTKLCSCSDTVHQVHFQNWVQSVYGANILDYPTDERLIIYDDMLKEFNGKYTKAQSYLSFINLPVLEDPKNISFEVLGEKYRDLFIKYYFDERKIEVQSISTEYANLFLRVPAMFSLKFKHKHS